MDVNWADAVILPVFKGHIGGCGDPPYVMIVTTHTPNKKTTNACLPSGWVGCLRGSR